MIRRRESIREGFDPAARLPARRVEPELLDVLSASDPDAVRSRRDLRRINWLLGNAAILANLIGTPPASLAELGGGDGTLLLEVARRLGSGQQPVQATLVDRQELVTRAVAAQLGKLGWKMRVVQGDALSWLGQADGVDVIVTNLFLHHFSEAVLRNLFAIAASRAQAFVACEPRRLRFPRLAGEMVGLVGCNRVTRHDAVASIRAGFAGQELSKLWPSGGSWRLVEGAAGLFSHSFLARRA